jgi:peptide/nickel transport system permease protein
MRMLARRIGFYLLTAIAAVTVIFLLPRVIPGNPVDAVIGHMQGQTITKSTLRALEVQFGQNSTTGTWGQYLHYWSNLAHGNLGVSTSEGMVPVTTVIRGALPWTLGLVGTATVLSFILGTLIGILVAWHHSRSGRGPDARRGCAGRQRGRCGHRGRRLGGDDRERGLRPEHAGVARAPG